MKTETQISQLMAATTKNVRDVHAMGQALTKHLDHYEGLKEVLHGMNEDIIRLRDMSYNLHKRLEKLEHGYETKDPSDQDHEAPSAQEDRSEDERSG